MRRIWALPHRLIYAGRHSEHPDLTAALLVVVIVFVSIGLIVGSLMAQPLIA